MDPEGLRPLAEALNSRPDTRLVDDKEAVSRFRSLFRSLCDLIGEDRAHKIWTEAGKRKPGRKVGNKKYDMEPLIADFDRVRSDDNYRSMSNSSVMKEIAEFYHEKFPGKYGASLDGIAKNLENNLRRRRREREKMNQKLRDLFG